MTRTFGGQAGGQDVLVVLDVFGQLEQGDVAVEAMLAASVGRVREHQLHLGRRGE